MITCNPYGAPKADIAAPVTNEAGIEQVASAQKLIIYSILAYFAGAAARTFLGPIGLLVVVCAVLIGLVGTFRLCSGLGYSMATRVILIVLMFVPLVSLIVLLVLNAKATGKLRAAGYHVGLLGRRAERRAVSLSKAQGCAASFGTTTPLSTTRSSTYALDGTSAGGCFSA